MTIFGTVTVKYFRIDASQVIEYCNSRRSLVTLMQMREQKSESRVSLHSVNTLVYE